MAERVEAAAILVHCKVWKVPKPGRHCDVIRLYCAYTGRRCIPPKAEAGCVQGFVTSTGRFVDRETAAQIALDAGQINEAKDYLFSEDVW
jgi:hypothetical protein